MKRYLAVPFCLLLLAGCGGQKTSNTEEEVPADTMTVVDTTAVETVDALDNLPMPKAADELFDDFIFNFAANKTLQAERVLFPLKKVNGDKVETINRDQWKTERYFLRQQYYTLLFDSEKQMEVVKDTSVNHAVVEMIYFNTGAVIQYQFRRLRGAWMLTEVDTQPLASNPNASFLQFYHKFVTDSVFQGQSLEETVQFVGPDPDDDFQQMEGFLTPDTWPAFAPELPDNMLYNIVYGPRRPRTDNMIFMLRGIANGLELELTFKRHGDNWKLAKMTT